MKTRATRRRAAAVGSARQPIIPLRVRPLLERIGRIASAERTSAYAVGGCVRDWCLGVASVTDLDVTAEGDGIAVAKAVARALGGTVEAHAQFGTATVRLTRRTGRGIDFASCRREVYVRPGAYPNVSAGTLEDDLCRRDFTINAMAVALAPDRFGRLVDPFRGRDDLSRRLLRILHGRSFLDDPSRILRGIRLAARFDLRWEPDTARALREAVAAGALSWLNAGRLRKELDRMLDEPDPRACLVSFASVLGA